MADSFCPSSCPTVCIVPANVVTSFATGSILRITLLLPSHTYKHPLCHVKFAIKLNVDSNNVPLFIPSVPGIPAKTVTSAVSQSTLRIVNPPYIATYILSS